jgi:RHS repeat-associated protein
MRGTTCCEQDASLAIIRRALRIERIVTNADVATTTYTYDANGNVTQAGGWSYVWDYLNRMLASGYNNSTTTYGYDATGARVLQNSTTSTTYYPSKYFSLASTTSGGTSYSTSTNYIWLGDTLLSTIDQKLYNGTATGTSIIRYVHPDHLGSTNVVTDASGSIAQLLDYYPYVAARVSSSSYPTNEKRQYIGQFSDLQTNLSYLNARYLDPQRGQFLSEDPVFLGNPLNQNLQNPQTLNVYAYANGNPITGKDPLGLLALRLGGEYVIPGWGLGANGGVYIDQHGIDYYYAPILATGGGGSVTGAITTADLQHVYSISTGAGVTVGAGPAGELARGMTYYPYTLRKPQPYTEAAVGLGEELSAGVSAEVSGPIWVWSQPKESVNYALPLPKITNSNSKSSGSSSLLNRTPQSAAGKASNGPSASYSQQLNSLYNALTQLSSVLSNYKNSNSH